MGKGKDVGNCLSECCIKIRVALMCFGVVILVIVLFLIGLSMAKIVMGAIYFHDCDLERMIPIFLIVSAVAPILVVGFWIENDKDSSRAWRGCYITGFLFSLAWLIAGSVWVYGTWSKVHADTYIPCPKVNATAGCTQGTCNETLLTFSVAMVSIDWILSGLYGVPIGCMIAGACAK